MINNSAWYSVRLNIACAHFLHQWRLIYHEENIDHKISLSLFLDIYSTKDLILIVVSNALQYLNIAFKTSW